MKHEELVEANRKVVELLYWFLHTNLKKGGQLNLFKLSADSTLQW